MRVCDLSPRATDGEIAAINLQSARRRARSRFDQDPCAPGAAEALVEKERLAAEFLGDYDAFDRMAEVASRLVCREASFRAALLEAEVAAVTHRFKSARVHLERAALLRAPLEDIARHTLTIDQACGRHLDAVLAARRRMAASDRLDDLAPLGAVFADLGRIDEADATYRRALREYDGFSPFPLAWVCFQLGVLWGELAPEANADAAADWYRRAIDYLPAYVKARVHLAEILVGRGQTRNAERLLRPALASGDPEVRWRLADVLNAQGRFDEAKRELSAARALFEELLRKHQLAFADHAAEFFRGSGGDHALALELARANFANRPTRRAFELVHAIAQAQRCGAETLA